MGTPIERFKGNWANHRYNPFTADDMSEEKTEDSVYVPNTSPFVFQLLEVPRKESPSSISVYCYSDSKYFTEVETSPTQGEFRVDYPPPDGKGTGLLEFNQNDANKNIRIIYQATGSPAVTEFLDVLVPQPAGSPGENQIPLKKAAGWAWAYNPTRYFHEGNVAYNAGGESESCLLFRFKKGVNESKALLELMGAKLWQGLYSEVGEHPHGPGSLCPQDSGNHVHPAGSHEHPAGSLTGFQPKHQHGGIEPGGNETTFDGDDQVEVSAVETAVSDGEVGEGGGHNHGGMNGQTAVNAVTPKTYPDSLKVFIDGTDRTAALLVLCGLDKLGDGTDAHAFITAGTGEMDITSLLAGGTFHDIKITEPTAAKGGRVLLHLEAY